MIGYDSDGLREVIVETDAVSLGEFFNDGFESGGLFRWSLVGN